MSVLEVEHQGSTQVPIPCCPEDNFSHYQDSRPSIRHPFTQGSSSKRFAAFTYLTFPRYIQQGVCSPSLFSSLYVQDILVSFWFWVEVIDFLPRCLLVQSIITLHSGIYFCYLKWRCSLITEPLLNYFLIFTTERLKRLRLKYIYHYPFYIFVDPSIFQVK